MELHHFISYSSNDALDFALRLRDELRARQPPIPAWLDRRDVPQNKDWDKPTDEALRTCDSLLFMMSRDGVDCCGYYPTSWSPCAPTAKNRSIDRARR